MVRIVRIEVFNLYFWRVNHDFLLRFGGLHQPNWQWYGAILVSMTTPMPGNGAVVAAGKAIAASAVRTWTPIVLALVIKALNFFRINIPDNELLTQAIEVVISSAIAIAIYVAIRALEVFKSSKFGTVLLGLGIKASPVYATPPAVVSTVQAEAADPGTVPPPTGTGTDPLDLRTFDH